jgi:hypothetical protein
MSKETLKQEVERLEKEKAAKLAEIAKLEELEQQQTITDAPEVIRAWLKSDDSYNEKEILLYDYGEDSFEFNGFTFKREEVYGGGEGDGEEYWAVFSVSNGDETRYFKADGWYASYEGGYIEWENFFEVRSEKKTIDVWVNK